MLAVKIGQQTTGEGQPEQVTSKEAGRNTVQNQAVNTALINAGKQVITQGFQQYADLTGAYAVSDAFNAVMSIGSDIAILSTGPVGWVAVGAKYAVNIGGNFSKQTKALRELELQNQRLGYVSTQGSRYK